MMATKPIMINKAHCMCRHLGQVEVHEICNLYSQEITKRGFKQCQHCGKAKAKQFAVVKENQEHIITGTKGHRTFIDKLISKSIHHLTFLDGLIIKEMDNKRMAK
jgi:hypothetical protein